MTRDEAIQILAPHEEATDIFRANRFIEWLELLGVLVLDPDESEEESD